MAAVAASDADVRPGETLCRPCVGVAWRRAYRRPAAQGACLLVCEETVVAELVARGDRGSQETRRDSADDPRRTFRSGTGAGAADHRAFALRPHRAEQGMAGREQPDARAADGRRGARRRGPGIRSPRRSSSPTARAFRTTGRFTSTDPRFSSGTTDWPMPRAFRSGSGFSTGRLICSRTRSAPSSKS